MFKRNHASQLNYFLIKFGGKNKYICSNNISVHDRLTLPTMVKFRKYFNNLLKWTGIVPTVFMSAMLFRNVRMPYKILYL